MVHLQRVSDKPLDRPQPSFEKLTKGEEVALGVGGEEEEDLVVVAEAVVEAALGVVACLVVAAEAVAAAMAHPVNTGLDDLKCPLTTALHTVRPCKRATQQSLPASFMES